MPFLTFEEPGPEQPDISDLANAKIPDEIECGENNEVWVKVIRSKKLMLLISKVDGSVKKKVEIGLEFPRIAASYGVGPRQIGAVLSALELK